VDLGETKGREQSGRRPILGISHEVFNQKSGTVIGVAVTSKEPKAGFPLTLELIGTKLPKRSWLKIGQIRTIATERLEKKIGRIGANEIESVIEGLLEIVG
jgi:mRNA interferase MazF